MKHFFSLFLASYLRFLPGHPTILFSSPTKTRPSADQASPAPVSTPSPARYFPPGFMWRRSRTSWSARSCVMNGNPLSERSELWISVNAFSRFRQTLVFRPAATETRLETGARGVLEATLFIFPPPGNKPQNAPVQPPGEEYPPSGTHPSQTDTSPQTGIPASDSQGS